MNSKILIILITLLTSLTLYPTAVSANLSPLLVAFDTENFDVLLQIKDSAKPGTAEAIFANAAIDSLLNRLEPSKDKFLSIIQSTSDAALVTRAKLGLSGIHIRQGNYAQGADLLTEIARLPKMEGIELDENTVNFIHAMRSVPTMQVSPGKPGSVALVYDKVDLPRINISVNGVTDQSVFDTGASLSTVTLSVAQKMQLKQINPTDGGLEVGGSTSVKVESGLAYAETMRIGNVVIKNVPFIVVPDEALNFKQRNYAITSIIGLPVISSLGRLTISNSGKQKTMHFEPSSAEADPDSSNMLISGLQSLIRMRIGDQKNHSQLFLDTGARMSDIHQNVEVFVPDLLDNAETGNRFVSGVGAQVESEDTRVLQSIGMEIGEMRFQQGPISVVGNDVSKRNGVIGQDILSRFMCVVIDYGAMSLSLNNESCNMGTE